MNDYQRIALVIRYLDERHTDQPDLASLALPPPSPANSREKSNIPRRLIPQSSPPENFFWEGGSYRKRLVVPRRPLARYENCNKEPDMSCNKLNVLSMILGLGLAVAGTPAGAAANADSLQQVVERGKGLFMTATFEGNGRHCNTCHKGGGTAMGELPDGKQIPSLGNAAAIFPRYDGESHRVKTLQDQVQHCALNALKGKPPAYDSAEMTELVTYLTSLSQGKRVDMGGKPQ